MGALSGEPGGVKEGPGDGGLDGKPGGGLICRGVYVWKKVLGWVSLHIGAPFGDLGRGVLLP